MSLRKPQQGGSATPVEAERLDDEALIETAIESAAELLISLQPVVPARPGRVDPAQ
jgi:hypothetical protein